MQEEHLRLGYLDAWRLFAVSLVIVNHALMYWGVRWPVLGNEGLLEVGKQGVYIFFFISGFVVSRVALKEMRESGQFSVAAFYIRRAFRILPPLAIYLFACTLLALSGAIDMQLAELIPAVLFQCNSEFFTYGWYVAALWSLAYEEQFYLIFPLLVAWSLTPMRRKFATIVVWLMLSMPAFLVPSPWFGRTGFILAYGLFLAGHLCARKAEWGRHITNPNLLFVLGTAITFYQPGWLPSDFLGKYYKLSYLLSVPLMIVASGHPGFFLRKLFEHSAIRYVGRASYSIYLWQQLFTSAPAASLPLPAQLALAAAMVLLLLVLFEYVERPLIAYSHGISKSWQSRVTLAASPA